MTTIHYKWKTFSARLTQWILVAAFVLSAQISFADQRSNVRCDYDVYEDKTTELLFSQVTTAHRDDFKAIEKKNLGYSKSNFWMRIGCYSSSKSPWQGILEVDYSLLDTVDVFYPGQGNEPKYQFGDTVSFYDRPVHYRHPAIPLFIASKANSTIYIKFASQGSVQVPIKVRSEREFLAYTSSEYLVLGFYNGLVAVIALLILALAINMKEKFYIYQLCYLMSFHLLQVTINGLGFQYLWFNSTWFNNHAPSVMAAWSSGFAIMFSREYLKSKTYFPRFDRAIVAIIYVCLLLPVLGFFLSQKTINSFASPMGLGVTLVLTMLGVASIPKGVTSAGYFVAGWACMLVGIFVSSMKGLGLLPISFFTSYAMQLGGLMEMILLAVGFTWRLRESDNAKRLMELKAMHLESESQKLEVIAKTAQLLAHDIRKPFSMIKMVTNMLNRAKSPNEIASILEKLGPRLSEAQSSVESMLADLLEVKAHPNLHREELKLSTILDSSLEQVTLLFRDKAIKIERNFEHSLPIFGDPSKLQRALGNVLQNAYEAVGQRGRIWLTTREITSVGITATELTIGNEGSFVPEELRSKIFDMNFTTGKAGGTGLGLAIAKKVVEEHGGTITCHADKKIGTWFKILLPTAVKKEGSLSETQRPHSTTNERNSAS